MRRLRRYFNWGGRATQANLWVWILFLVVVMAVFALLIRILQTNVLTAPIWLKWTMGVTALLLLPSTLARVARRLHDLGWSSFTIFAWAFTVAVLAAVGLLLLPSIAFFLLGAAAALTLFFGLFLLFTDGERGPNNYGPDPKGRLGEI